MSEILIKIKQTSSNTTNEIKISKEATVAELKTKIEELTSIKPELQNLVYKGRILANEKILNDYGLDNDHVIILVKKYVEEKKEDKSSDKKETTNTSNTSNTNNTTLPNNQTQNNLNQDPFSMYGNMGFGGMGGMGGMGGLGGNMDMNQLNELMSNPMYQQAMDQVLSNPQMVQRMLENPQIKPLLDQNPHLRQMMSNPDFLRTMMNPQTLQGLSSMMGGQGQGLNQGQGQNQGNQGINPLLFGGFPLGGTTNSGQSSTNTENTGTSNTNTTNTNPLGNLYSGLNFNPYQNVNPREAYQEQNKKLKEMGFTNDDANYEALGKTGGNVDAAVERLLNMLG